MNQFDSSAQGKGDDGFHGTQLAVTLCGTVLNSTQLDTKFGLRKIFIVRHAHSSALNDCLALHEIVFIN